MTSPDHGLALSDSAIEFFKWLNNNSEITDYLEVLTTPFVPTPGRYNFYSIPMDVRGRPHMTLQLSADSLQAENNFGIDIQTSLDGSHWDTIPQALMSIIPNIPLQIQNDFTLTLTMLMRTNFIRVNVFTGNGAPWPTGQIKATIVKGEA